MIVHKFDVGDRVLYKGLVATVEGKSNFMDNHPCYALVAEIDPELTCTAAERDCEAYTDQDIGQLAAVHDANLASLSIQNRVGNITDKYFRDGNHQVRNQGRPPLPHPIRGRGGDCGREKTQVHPETIRG